MRNNIAYYFLFISSIILFSVLFNSCSQDIPEISRRNRIVADSIFRAAEVDLKDEIDSLCKLIYKENFDKAVDSISSIRLAEIEKILSVR